MRGLAVVGGGPSTQPMGDAPGGRSAKERLEARKQLLDFAFIALDSKFSGLAITQKQLDAGYNHLTADLDLYEAASGPMWSRAMQIRNLSPSSPIDGARRSASPAMTREGLPDETRRKAEARMNYWNRSLYSAIKRRRKQYEEECRKARAEARPIPLYLSACLSWVLAAESRFAGH